MPRWPGAAVLQQKVLETTLLKYIDDEKVDRSLFELGSYNSKPKSSPVALTCMATLWPLVAPILGGAPAARLHKSDLKRCLGATIDGRPARAIMPSIPRANLLENVATQVAHVFLGVVIL